MDNESIASLIDYLLKREFRSLAPPPMPRLGTRNDEAAQASYSQMVQKRAGYQAMSIDEVRAVAEEARRTDAEARTAKLKEEDAKLFFNLPRATADFRTWSQMATWSLDEAIALSLGKSPWIVNWENVSQSGERFVPEAWAYSPFPKEYARRRELVRRANAAHELGGPIRPGKFLEWAKHIGLPYPPELEAAVAERTPIADLRRELSETTARIAELERELANARDEASHRWPWGTYETKILRILASAASRFWANYDPADPGTANTNETVAAWLRENGAPSDRLANAIATILRADGLAPGPR